MTEAEFRYIEEESTVGEDEESLSCEVDVEVLLQLSEQVGIRSRHATALECMHSRTTGYALSHVPRQPSIRPLKADCLSQSSSDMRVQ